MKRLCIFLAFLVLCVNGMVQVTAAIDVSAGYACLMDSVTGRVLYEKNAREKHPMASTTKIMTAVVALEACDINDVVTVSSRAAGTEGSSLYLEAGEKMRMEDLLYGLMLRSGNDSAVAIAEYISGTSEEFAKRMTEKAHEIGAKDTQFKTPNGLDDEGHHTTAYDLALITRYALKNETFAQIVATKKKSIPWESRDYDRQLVNHNKLLNLYEGCIGVKTGFTKKAGRCLVSAAERNGWRVIAVTLNAPNDWQDHAKMLDYAYNSYQVEPLVMESMVIKTVPVEKGSDDMVPLYPQKPFHVAMESKNDLARYRIDYELPKQMTAPVSDGQVLGKMVIRYDGEVCQEINLVSHSDITYEEPPEPKLGEKIGRFFAKLFKG